MKKGETPELAAKWWKGSQPKGLASGAKLELTLRAHEIAAGAFKKEPKPDKLANALDTLDQVADAVAKVVAEAGKAKGNAEMEFTVQALKKIDFAKEKKQLEGAVKEGDEDDEDDLSALADPVAYAKTLRKSLTKVKDSPYNWGFLAGGKPTDHRFLLHRSKNGRTLAIAAAKELGRPAKVTFGTCVRSPDDNATVILTVQGAMLSGLATRIKKMLLKMKPQPINEVVLSVNGQIVPEAFDPDDVDQDDPGPGDAQTEDAAMEALHGRIAALEPRAAAVMAAMPDYADRLRASISALMAAMAKSDVSTAGGMLGKLEEIVTRLETMPARPSAPDTPAAAEVPAGGPAAARDSLRKAAESIAAALATADAQIRKFQAFLAVHPDPQLREIGGSADLGINALTGGYRVRVLAVLEDLRRTPDDKLPAVLARARKIVAEFGQHLRTSERIDACEQNSFGIPVSVRPVLEPALAELNRSLERASA